MQIATAADQQAIATEEIKKSLLNINHLAKISAEGAQTTLQANSNITERVADLNDKLNVFVV
jgi:methyl-accepting chemotaxis protein